MIGDREKKIRKVFQLNRFEEYIVIVKFLKKKNPKLKMVCKGI